MKDVVKEIAQKYNKKEEVIHVMLYKTIELGYNMDEIIDLMDEYYSLV